MTDSGPAGIVHSASDGVLKPKVVTQRVAGLSPYNFLHFSAVLHGARACGRKRKESRVRGGVCQLAHGIISSSFQYLGRAVKEKHSGGRTETTHGSAPTACHCLQCGARHPPTRDGAAARSG